MCKINLTNNCTNKFIRIVLPSAGSVFVSYSLVFRKSKYKILLSCPWTILWLITVQVTEFDPCFASSLHHWLWVHQNSQLYFTVLDVTFDFVLKLVLALFSGRAEIPPKNNLYRALTKIYGTNKKIKVDSK